MSDSDQNEELKYEMRQSLKDEFGKAEYPVEGIRDFMFVLSNGPLTKFKAGDIEVSVMDLAMKSKKGADFPYEDVDSLVDDIMFALEEDDKFD